MLTIFGQGNRFCDGISRRSFLRAGGLALGGLALSDLLRLKAQGAVSAAARGKSVIMICLGGGPSHIDTYDMKPGAPSEIRGEFRPIKSNVPGMELSELLPQQAKIADKFAVVRSATWQEPARLDRPGLTAGQREAYAAVYAFRLRRDKDYARAAGERRLREALTHAGAELRDYAERGDVYTVTYTVDGGRHTSVVRKSDLSVQTAGICLSGEDQKFDLHSLVGVLRQGRGAGRVR